MSDPYRPTSSSVPGQPGQQPQRVVPHAPANAPRPSMAPPPVPGQRPGIAGMPMQPLRATEADLDPIALVEDELEEITSPVQTAQLHQAATAAPPKSKIKAFGPDMARREHSWKRMPHVSGQGAIRVKSFHGKYSDTGVEHLDDMINEWIDAHPEVEVKFVTSTVNVFEGKIREPALVLNLWY
ncbi:MAG: hypothetical protein H7Z14_13875 [Anaerolineae bacterium]|nr:hypothetical protein [Phycisphaerae bacterium]